MFNFIASKGRVGRKLRQFYSNQVSEVIFNNSDDTLNLAGRGGDEAIEALSEALLYNSSIKHLSLWGNNFGGPGTTALSKTLKKKSSLTKLDLSANDITDLGLESLCNALKKNTTLQELQLNSIK